MNAQQGCTYMLNVNSFILLVFSGVLTSALPSVIMPPAQGALSDDVCLTSVCLMRTSGLSREQRGLGRLKLAQR